MRYFRTRSGPHVSGTVSFETWHDTKHVSSPRTMSETNWAQQSTFIQHWWFFLQLRGNSTRNIKESSPRPLDIYSEKPSNMLPGFCVFKLVSLPRWGSKQSRHTKYSTSTSLKVPHAWPCVWRQHNKQHVGNKGIYIALYSHQVLYSIDDELYICKFMQNRVLGWSWTNKTYSTVHVHSLAVGLAWNGQLLNANDKSCFLPAKSKQRGANAFLRRELQQAAMILKIH